MTSAPHALLPVAHNFVRVCWMAFVLVWIASALSVRRAPAKRRQSVASWLLVIPFGMAGMVLMFVSSRAVPLGIFDLRFDNERSDGLSIAAMVLTALGVGLAIWARGSLGGNWSGRIAVREGQELVVSGPYRLVRHPIYAGILLAFFGTAFLRFSPRAFLGVLLFFGIFLYRIRVEERFLGDEFGARWEEYRSRVKALIPFVI